MTAKYSFILPAYKAQFFHDALDSILSQTYKDFELIIVNDASPEDLDSIVNSYNDKRIRYYVNEENIGGKDLVAQWNHCLEYAIGEYVILASDDDVYSPLYLEKMDELVCKYPEVNVFRPRIQLIDGEDKVFCVLDGMPEFVSRMDFLYNWMLARIGSGIPYYVFKKEALIEISGFKKYPLAWFSDDATVFELSKNGLAFYDEVLFSFRFSGINITTKRNSKTVLASKLEALRRFDEWIWPCINNENIHSDKELKIVENVKSNWPAFIRHKSYDLLDHSSLRAALGNISKFAAVKWNNLFWIIKCYVKLIVKRILK